MEELKLRLPAALRYMVESHKHKISHLNLTAAHSPDRFPILFHWTALMFLRRIRETVNAMTRDGAYSYEPSDRFGHILCEFRTCNRPRRVAKISCRNLTTPRLITWPLVLYSIRYGYGYI